MDWMQFVSSVIAALAWPIAVVVIVFVFKEALLARLPNLLKVTLPGGIEAEFSKDLAEVEAVSQAALQGPAAARPVLPTVEELPLSTIDVPINTIEFIGESNDNLALRANPTGVVMESWKALESKLRFICKKLAPDVTFAGSTSGMQFIKLLKSKNFLDSRQSSTLDNLMKLRNMAAHSDDPISEESAAKFREFAEDISIELVAKLNNFLRQ
ncbi:hypothetical protein [Janthinobacterium sp. SUN033]|uniref:hypothetical protein n=1 Tax=Janthinobacterium sp. SUN033 TaxID=3002439 RepID=UPI0025B16C5B|nr:hypothetical protein [Janthinobacterium sp. SUN033]MDN2676760.1 hypothetical protein [Janthinobacterium sp. SUN033]